MKTHVLTVKLLAVINVATAGEGRFVGFQAKDRATLDTTSNILIPNLRAIVPEGTLTEYGFYARRAGTIRLQVWRHTSDKSYELVSQTPVNVSSAGLHTVRPDGIVKVKAGDVLGFYTPGHGIIPFDGEKCTDNIGLFVPSAKKSSIKP